MITVYIRIPVHDYYGYGNRDPEEVANDIVDKIKKAGFPDAELDDILLKLCHYVSRMENLEWRIYKS